MTPQVQMLQTPQGTLQYTLSRKQVKNLNLRVRPDGSVAVSAPLRMPQERITAFVLSKAVFVTVAQERFAQQEAATREMDESKVSWFGCELSVEHHVGATMVERQGDTLYVTAPETLDSAGQERLLRPYLEREMDVCFQAMARRIHQDFAPLGIAMPKVRSRWMKSRWGSCLPTKGIITLNRHLAALEQSLSEYVLYHEFCHFIHPNHGAQFYDLLESFVPDWQEKRQHLRGFSLLGMYDQYNKAD